jgi:hypothetical protein
MSVSKLLSEQPITVHRRPITGLSSSCFVRCSLCESSKLRTKKNRSVDRFFLKALALMRLLSHQLYVLYALLLPDGYMRL